MKFDELAFRDVSRVGASMLLLLGKALGKTLGKNGAGDGIRTRDIDLGKVALYQLSYSRDIYKPFILYPSG